MEKPITAEEFYNKRISSMKQPSLFEMSEITNLANKSLISEHAQKISFFDTLIKTDNKDFITLAIEPHNVQLINVIDTKKEIDAFPKMLCMPDVKVASSEINATKLSEMKKTETITLNLKESSKQQFKTLK